jgi:hypothetical protein
MPFIPQQAPPNPDTEGLLKHGEDQMREVARAWTEVEASIVATAAAGSAALTAGLATKVAKAGDTMTGPLTLAMTYGATGLQFYENNTTWSKYIRINNAGALEWINHAFNAVLMTLNEAGTLTALGNMSCNVMFCNGMTCGGVVTASQFKVGDAQYNPTNIELGSLSAAGVAFIDFHSSGSGSDYDTRIISAGGGGSGTGALSYVASGGHTFTGGMVVTGQFEGQGGVVATGHRCRNGGFTSGSYSGNWFNLYYTGSSSIVHLWIDNTDFGSISLVSDYRTKKDVAALPGMWETVKRLRPIKYTSKDFTPPSEAARAKETGKPFMVGDDIERWGFMAHELQETLVESAASASKDAPNAIQSPDMRPVIAALTKALQEAMARIEALEGKR